MTDISVGEKFERDTNADSSSQGPVKLCPLKLRHQAMLDIYRGQVMASGDLMSSGFSLRTLELAQLNVSEDLDDVVCDPSACNGPLERSSREIRFFGHTIMPSFPLAPGCGEAIEQQ
jgi:hypothetical protein